jgi:hypothetical protein
MNTVHEEVMTEAEGAVVPKKAKEVKEAESEEPVDLAALCGSLEGCLHRLKGLQHQMQEQETVEKALAAALSVAKGAGRRFGAVLLHELLLKIETRTV